MKSEDSRDLSAEAREIFSYWKEATKHPRSCLDEKRSKLITARLKDGYAKEDLMLAVLGCSVSRFHQGENDGNRIYDSVELIFRNADKVDSFIRYGEDELKRREIKKRRDEQIREETLAKSVKGPGYESSRDRLLSLVKKIA